MVVKGKSAAVAAYAYAKRHRLRFVVSTLPKHILVKAWEGSSCVTRVA
jgi:hypothetical protein